MVELNQQAMSPSDIFTGIEIDANAAKPGMLQGDDPLKSPEGRLMN
jgi:hypothetical protein